MVALSPHNLLDLEEVHELTGRAINLKNDLIGTLQKLKRGVSGIDLGAILGFDIPDQPAQPRTKTATSSKNTMTLEEAVCEIVQRGKWVNNPHVDLPKRSKGIKAGEITRILLGEKRWHTTSRNLATQVTAALKNLVTEGFIQKNDQGRYEAIKTETYVPKSKAK